METFKAKYIDMDTTRNEIVMHEADMKSHGLHSGDRVKVISGKKSCVAMVNETDTIVQSGVVGVLSNVYSELDLDKGYDVRILPAPRPESVEHIKKKMRGEKLSKHEIELIVRDIVERNLSNVELAAYVTSVAIRGMDLDEIEALTRAMVAMGDTIDLDVSPVFDHHSIGGVPGNKITLLIVPIVAAAGLFIPKTCSRAISSASGTADTFETVANVSLSLQDIKDITEDVGGVIAWGGAVNMAPADDIIIRVEYPLSLDPYSQVIASVMAKKKAVGADFLVLDIPMGPGTKVPDMALAKRYASDFLEIGRRIGIHVESAITYGGQPIGYAIGPALEIREALMAMEGKKSPGSLIGKSTAIAGRILELGGVAAPGTGREMALNILKSGKALAKFREIVEAQGGQPKISCNDIKIGKYSYDFKAPSDGYISALDNAALVAIARAAGAPNDKGAGIYLYKKRGPKVKKGDTIFTIYAENKEKMEHAVGLLNRRRPVTIEGMVLEFVPSYFHV